MPREFTYKGYTIEELLQISMDDFIKVLPSRQRRSLLRGLSTEQKKFIEKLRSSKRKKEKGGKLMIKTHCRDVIILPEMVGTTILLHSGNEFVPVDITPKKIGHYLGEFV
ncbi:MAG: 30S ribosomal protein S19, partial [Candidatus Bathyarchaeota archaeon]